MKNNNISNKSSQRYNNTSISTVVKMLLVVVFIILSINFNNHTTTVTSCLAWTTKTGFSTRIPKMTKSITTPLTFTRHSNQQQQQQQQQQQLQHSSSSTTKLYLKNLLNTIPSFLQKRQNDFIPINQSKNKYGPGPCILLIDIPVGIGTDEIYNMISDTCCTATIQQCKLYRISTTTTSTTTTTTTTTTESSKSSGIGIDLDTITVQEIMEQISKGILVTVGCSDDNDDDSIQLLPTTNTNVVDTNIEVNASTTSNDANTSSNIPVLLFSGFDDKEMIQFYNVLTNEIYQEFLSMTSPSSSLSTTNTKFIPPACSKLVPNSKNKSISQILYEIRGDHLDAVTSTSTSTTTTTSTITSTE